MAEANPPVAGKCDGAKDVVEQDFGAVPHSAPGAGSVLSVGRLRGGYANAGCQIGGRKASRDAGEQRAQFAELLQLFAAAGAAIQMLADLDTLTGLGGAGDGVVHVAC